jgi:RNA polymerase sigma-70 factor (ECF subfamily)
MLVSSPLAEQTMDRPSATAERAPRQAAVKRTTSYPPSRNARDLALLERIKAGDRAAFKELYFVYHARLARFLTRITARYDVAEEIINDTFWIVWDRAKDFRNASQVSTWIMGIAYRRGLKTLRKLSATPIAEAPLDEVMMLDEDEPAVRAEIEQWLEVALARLPLEQRVVLELAYHLGHSCEEIAVITECPVNTVKTRMHYAREKLRRLLPQLAGVSEGERP